MGGVLAHFRVTGWPRTKGSLKVYCTKGPKHKVRVEEEVTESKRWRLRVAYAAQQDQLQRYGRLQRYPDAVEVRLVFFYSRTESVHGGPIPSHDSIWPTHKEIGDVDKTTRNILDALTDSGLLADDSQVVTVCASKLWAPEGAGAEVQVLVLEVDPPAFPEWMPDA